MFQSADKAADRPTSADRPQAVRNAAAERPATLRSRSTNRRGFVHGVDGRSVLMRRRRDLIEAFVAALGGASVVSQAAMINVTRAADAVVIAEDHRARALRGEPIDLDALVRIENISARAVKALGIKPAAKPPGPSLAEYLASTREDAST